MFFLLLTIITIYSKIYYESSEENNEILINSLVQSIKNENITKDFLSWIYDNYDAEVLIKIYKYLKENSYSHNIWHEITGNSYYKEVHISDLIILDEYRNNHIGSKLVQTVEDYFKGKGFENINLTTYGFQAPEFYKKCGFNIEFIRKNKENPKLDKYYLVKYFGGENERI